MPEGWFHSLGRSHGKEAWRGRGNLNVLSMSFTQSLRNTLIFMTASFVLCTLFPKWSDLLLSHRITELLRLEETFGGHLVQPLAQAGPSRAGCSGPGPDCFWIPPQWGTPQRLWASCASAWSPRAVKKCWLMFRKTLLYFSSVQSFDSFYIIVEFARSFYGVLKLSLVCQSLPNKVTHRNFRSI